MSNANRWHIRFSHINWEPVAICRDGVDVIHISPSERTNANVTAVVRMLNAYSGEVVELRPAEVFSKGMVSQ